VSDDLAAVRAPTLVVHRVDNRLVPVSHARYAAEGIPDATLVELPGSDHLGNLGDVDALFDPVEEFFTGRAPRRDRHLAAVLFTDLVDSTAHAVREGDRRWSSLLAEHDQVAREVVAANGGDVVKSTGDGILAVFTGPGAAIRAAQAIQAKLASRQLRVRAGIHAGEIERLANDVTGIAVTIAARVMEHAQGGEVLVSGAVPPLVAGTGLEFESRNEVELKGVPGAWALFSPR
jgi:class 3 adenylate cyclase